MFSSVKVAKALFDFLSITDTELLADLNIILSIADKKDHAAAKGDYEKAAHLRSEEIRLLTELLESLNQKNVMNNNVLHATCSPLHLKEFQTDKEGHILDFIEDDPDFYEAIQESELFKTNVRRVIESFQPKDQKIIVFRFGLDEQGGHTLEETGEMFHVTIDYIRRLESQVLNKIDSL